jgi:hypothetical protein
MSANNFILIKKTKARHYEISERDAENGVQIGKVRKTNTGLNALRIANEMVYGDAYPVEYGIVFEEVESLSDEDLDAPAF